MIEWKEEVVIKQHIEKVWELFSEENKQRIMPKVESSKLVHEEPGMVGSKYVEKYREGKRVETYIVEVKGYEDLPHFKYKRISFVLAHAFEVDLSFQLEKISENETRFIYAGSNKGLNFVGKALMKLGGQKNNLKVVYEFLERVNNEALLEN
ncbi:hypothetical protein Q75_04255 [Bacillus coahuilensis p1.1.43]|uniref:SRPBCC family protein n=1 Tax=Bacillus coahuilensis p1.1.43 TaxID=1150625 RepID=A0A147KAJ2_9BACI|nr:SRPBCC family protein [Bacillus coahuilensis]KUP07721.1 hypothetical protein Q75_04255 [Bacillus coahuilensis p1.1.43]